MSKLNYSIRIHKRARKGLSKLPANRQQQARLFINSHLRLTPKQHIPAKTKRLSGPLKGIYQYDLSYGDRIWWRVDDNLQTVDVIYIGPHP